MTQFNLDEIFKNEDCLKFLSSVSSKSVELALIDPPYEISRKSNFQNGEPTGRDTDRFRIKMDFGEWDKDFSVLQETIQELYRVLKDNGTLICFYDLWKIETLKSIFESVGFKQLRFIEWIKTNPVPINSKINYLTNAREIAIAGVKRGKPTFHSSYDNGIYQCAICHDKGRFHPTQKPLELFEELILKHSNEGDTVIDCFAGSGTTAIAAIKHNRNFIGCELSTEYYEKAKQRIIKEDL